MNASSEVMSERGKKGAVSKWGVEMNITVSLQRPLTTLRYFISYSLFLV